MSLRMDLVAAQLPAVVDRYQAALVATGAALDEARGTLKRWNDDLHGANFRVEQAMRDQAVPYALAIAENPSATFAPEACPPVTVVAVDGSSIAPDRFAAVRCYALNVGHASLPYGVTREADLGATAEVGLDRELLDDAADIRAAPRGLAVRLLRDVCELERGAELASAAITAGAAVLLIDGTLLPWDLHTRQASEAALAPYRDRTFEALERLRAGGPALSVGAYISASAAREVAISLETLGAAPASPAPLLDDGDVLRRLLADGERSALFASRSSRPGRVEELLPGHEVAFFYLRVGDDVARVEVPLWASAPEQIGRLHAALVDQCARCDGYPRALQEAHEQAVISMGDRMQFERLLELLAGDAGLRAPANGKERSKRRRSL